MFDSKSKKPQIEPSLSPEPPFNRKIPRRLMMSDSYSLLKYFPKYYNDLYISLEDLNGAIQSKVKQLKLVRHLHGRKKGGSAYRKSHYEKIFKILFQSSRKTLKSLPVVSGSGPTPQDLALCLYFPRVKALDLEKYYEDRGSYRIYGSYGYFLSSCRFIENLRILCSSEFHLLLIKKIDKSERLISRLKILKLHLSASFYEIEAFRSRMIELLKYQNFLGHVTNLSIEDYDEKTLDWEVIQPVISSCRQLYSLSFSTGKRDMRIDENQDFLGKDFRLDLSCLQNLQVLKITVRHFQTFIKGIGLPPSVKRIDLEIFDHKKSGNGNFKEAFGIQDSDEMIEDEDARDWESLEKYEILNNFFEKWRKLNNLQVLNLKVCTFPKTDILRNLILPLLKAIPQLESFYLTTNLEEYRIPRADRLFDLEVFFSGIQSIKALKHFALSTDTYTHCVLSGTQKLFLLPNLASVEIQTKLFYEDFDLKKFLNGFLCIKPDLLIMNKNIWLRELIIFSAQDFLKIINVVNSVSHIENLQLHLEICLIAENLNDIYSNFKYPIARNTQLIVNIHLKSFEEKHFELTSEQKRYFKMIFGQLSFTVNTAYKYNCDVDSLDPLIYNCNILMKSRIFADE